MDYAWNESTFIQNSLNGLGSVMVGVVAPGQLGYNPNLKPAYPFNLTKASQNIKAACVSLGCSPSNPLTITYLAFNDPVSEAAAALLSSNINSLNAGVVISVQILAPSQQQGLVLKGQWQMAMGNLVGFSFDPISPLPFNALINSQSGQMATTSGFNDSSLQHLLNQALATVNQTQRVALYGPMNQQLMQTGHYFVMYQLDNVWATSPKVRIGTVNYFAFAGTFPLLTEMSAGTNAR